MLHGLAEDVLKHKNLDAIRGKVQLIFTSPPFPLNTKKKYGNLQGEEYLRWFTGFGTLFRELLAPNGSIVIELGNSWEPGLPTMSTLALKALLRFQEENNLHLCQEFICHNPARLPSPAQWVTIERIRLKDSFTRLWWLSPTSRPKANNRNVLKEYSASMQRLLKTKQFNAGKRPSEHCISEESFSINNGGAIPLASLVWRTPWQAILTNGFARSKVAMLVLRIRRAFEDNCGAEFGARGSFFGKLIVQFT